MAPTQTFDITTGCDLQEVDNAVNQALKEIRQRYDFKGVKAEIKFRRDDKKIILEAPDEFKIKAVYEVLRLKLTRRKVPLKNMHEGTIQPAAGSGPLVTDSIQRATLLLLTSAIILLGLMPLFSSNILSVVR